MRILVCGGRNFADAKHAYQVLDKLHRQHGIDVVIEGDARGADRIAGYWARRNRITNLKFPADWKAHGLAAGTIRNGQMLKEGKPDLVLAFPGGRGTADMIRRARAAGLPVQHEVLAPCDSDRLPKGHDREDGHGAQQARAAAPQAPHRPNSPVIPPKEGDVTARRSAFWQRIPGIARVAPPRPDPVTVFSASEEDEVDFMSDAERGSAALLRSIRAYLAKHQPGVRI